jgi:oxygen-independent coproporphyrinogen-3 oxidase
MDDMIPAFVDALKREIRYVGSTNPGYEIGTVYMGGGTPSLLAAEYLDGILWEISESFHIVSKAEISIECNPNDITSIKAQDIKTAGFNRISLGMQTADNTLLEIYKRDHKTAEVTQAIENLRRTGITNINIDLMFGGPGETLESWEYSLLEALKHEPAHLSLYNLILKGNTTLTKRVEKGELPAIDEDTEADMYELATRILHENRLYQYEISNWCREGYEARHNLQYWRNLPYLGLGPGAHGSAANMRTIVTKHPEKYINSMQQTDKDALKFPITPATSKAIRNTRQDEITNTIIMGMRLTREGINKDAFLARFHEDLSVRFQDSIAKHKELGLLEESETAIRLTERGRFLSNAVLRDFL